MSLFSEISARVRATDLPALSLAGWRQQMRTLAVLFKVRIVVLLLVAAAGGAFLGAGEWPGTGSLLILLVTGGLAAAGASALNQYLEREKDRQMGRTRVRPLPAGKIGNPNRVLAAGFLMILAPSLAVLPSNPALAFFLLAGAVIYVGIYTLWLKPRTLLNIVLGGAAGSAAVMSGGAAVNAWGDPGVITLALLLFLWTPCHFWSLALLYRREYRSADVPMLPAQIGPRAAAGWVLIHTVGTTATAFLLGLLPALGWLYLLPTMVAGADMLRHNGRLLYDPSPLHARSMFRSTNLFLLILLVAICLDAVL